MCSYKTRAIPLNFTLMIDSVPFTRGKPFSSQLSSVAVLQSVRHENFTVPITIQSATAKPKLSRRKEKLCSPWTRQPERRRVDPLSNCPVRPMQFIFPLCSGFSFDGRPFHGRSQLLKWAKVIFSLPWHGCLIKIGTAVGGKKQTNASDGSQS